MFARSDLWSDASFFNLEWSVLSNCQVEFMFKNHQTNIYFMIKKKLYTLIFMLISRKEENHFDFSFTCPSTAKAEENKQIKMNFRMYRLLATIKSKWLHSIFQNLDT